MKKSEFYKRTIGGEKNMFTCARPCCIDVLLFSIGSINKRFATDLSLFETDIHRYKQSRVTVRYYIILDRQRSKDSIPPQVLVNPPPPSLYPSAPMIICFAYKISNLGVFQK